VRNLYSVTMSENAIRRLFRVTRDSAGNLPLLPTVFPDYSAPVVRNTDAERELIMMCWGRRHPRQNKRSFFDRLTVELLCG
jgi:hypothetical protein